MKKTLLNNLVDDIYIKRCKNINIVLEGGGFNGAYEIGVLSFIKKLERKNQVKIHKISGVSIGSVTGLLYLIDKLDYYEKYYERMREEITKNRSFYTIKNVLTKIFNKITEKVFEKIKTDKLYISYFNLQLKKHITKSKFINKEDLFETILKSIHVPYINYKNEMSYIDKFKNEYIDGLYPYIFKSCDKYIASKTIYVSINHLNTLHNCYDTTNEKTPISRILHGILDCYDLFKYNKPSRICSYVEDWSIFNILYYKLKETILHLIVYMISYISIIAKFFTNSNTYFIKICKSYVIQFILSRTF
tara:strand:+ start:9703 stop:10614 length:912 start_codon:yes stop_codon:yes gene_type:complete